MDLFETVVTGKATVEEARELLRLYVGAMPYKEDDVSIISNCVNECKHLLCLRYLVVVLSTSCENTAESTKRWKQALGLHDPTLIEKTVQSWNGITELKKTQRDMQLVVSESERLFTYHQFCLRR